MSRSRTDAVYAAEDAWLAAWAQEPGVEHSNARFARWRDAVPFVAAVMARVNAERRDVGLDPRPVPRVRARKGALQAHYDPATATIALPTFESGGVWALNQATVLHELAHHLAPTSGHSTEFCETFVGLLRTLGWQRVADLLATEFDRLDQNRTTQTWLDKVAKLLAHAERAGTPAERDTYLAKAETLATEHSIDLARARAGQLDRSTGRPTTREIDLRLAGGPRLRNLLVVLTFRIAEGQGLRATVRGNDLVTFYGFAEDLDVADTLVAHLAPMMLRDSDDYLASDRHKESGFHGSSARISYCRAWATEVGRRLTQTREATEASIIEAESQTEASSTAGTALALRQKQIELDDYVGYEFKRLGVRARWTGPQTSDWSETASIAGKRAGSRASLSDRKALRR